MIQFTEIQFTRGFPGTLQVGRGGDHRALGLASLVGVSGRGLWFLRSCVCPHAQWVPGSGMRPIFATGLLARATETFPLDI